MEGLSGLWPGAALLGPRSLTRKLLLSEVQVCGGGRCATSGTITLTVDISVPRSRSSQDFQRGPLGGRICLAEGVLFNHSIRVGSLEGTPWRPLQQAERPGKGLSGDLPAVPKGEGQASLTSPPTSVLLCLTCPLRHQGPWVAGWVTPRSRIPQGRRARPGAVPEAEAEPEEAQRGEGRAGGGRGQQGPPAPAVPEATAEAAPQPQRPGERRLRPEPGLPLEPGRLAPLSVRLLLRSLAGAGVGVRGAPARRLGLAGAVPGRGLARSREPQTVNLCK